MVKMNTDKGYIRISNDVFTTLVGAAATSCFGVRGMAKRSASDGLVHLLKTEAMGKGAGDSAVRAITRGGRAAVGAAGIIQRIGDALRGFSKGQ